MALVHRPHGDLGQTMMGLAHILNTHICMQRRCQRLGRLALDRRLEVNKEHRPTRIRGMDSVNLLDPTLSSRTVDRVMPLICEISSTRAEGLRLVSMICVTG